MSNRQKVRGGEEKEILMADKVSRRIPDDLVEVPDAQYAPLKGLAPGSAEAQERQREAVQGSGLPLEVRTAKARIVFRLVPAGSFMMGSPPSESERSPNEAQHHVTLTKAFYCGKFQVTQDQWEHVMGSNPSYYRNAGKHAPVERVSWDDCQAFTKKLCQLEGVPEGTYRLLTEAAWEYACRAGTQTPFCYGNDLDSGMANFDGYHPYGSGRKCEARKGTMRVGSFHPNAWGLYDMHGNVWEWCQEWFQDWTSSGVAMDPLGPAPDHPRLCRGGGWLYPARDCRSANLNWFTPDWCSYDLGLRLARTIP